MTSSVMFDKKNRDNYIYYLSKAREESLKSKVEKAKIGCVLIRNGKIISKGYNKMRHNTLQGKFARWKESIHAEIDCLKKVMFQNIRGTVLVVYRENKKGQIANSKPCSYCMEFIKFLKIKRIVYTFDSFPYYRIEEA